MFVRAVQETRPNQISSFFLFYDAPENSDLLQGLVVESSSSRTERKAKYMVMDTSESVSPMLIRNYRYERQHLTLDKYMNDASSMLAPSHVTIEFSHQKMQQYLVIHVYFDHQCELTGNIKAKIIKKNTETGNKETIDKPELTSDELDNIKQHIKPLQMRLQKLHVDKATRIKALSKEISDSNTQLAIYSDAISEGDNHVKALQEAEKLTALIEKLNRYGYNDKRVIYLANLIKVLSQPKLEKSVAPKHTVIEKDDIILDVPVIECQKKSLFEQDKEAIAASLAQLQYLLNDDVNLDLAQEIALTQEINLDLLAFELTYASPSAIWFAKSIREQLQETSDRLTLLKNYCKAGHVDMAQKLFESIQDDIDLPSFFIYFVTMICIKSDANERQVAIAEYFYQKSSLFRDIILDVATGYTSASMFSAAANEEHVFFNVLTMFFYADQFELFMFFLKNSFASTLSAATINVKTGEGLSIYQTLIAFFAVNPKIKYLHALENVEPSVYDKTSSQVTHESINVRFLVSPEYSLTSASMFKEKNKPLGLFEREIVKVSRIPNPLKAACFLHGLAYPELIAQVATLSSPTEIIAELMSALHAYHLYEQVPSSMSGVQYCESERAMKTMMQQYKSSPTSMCLYYCDNHYFRNMETGDMQHAALTTQYLFSAFLTKFQQLTSSMQTTFIDDMLALGMRMEQRLPPLTSDDLAVRKALPELPVDVEIAMIRDITCPHLWLSILCYRAALLALSLAPVTEQHCRKMAHTMYRVLKFSKVDTYEFAQVINYIDHLPEETRDILKKDKLYQHVLSMIAPSVGSNLTL